MTRTPAGEPWLPDLCRLPRIATLLGVAELTVLVVALAPDGGAAWPLTRLVSASVFALWLALTVAVLLCVTRRSLSRFSKPIGAMLALALSALVAANGAAMVYVIDGILGYQLVPAMVTMMRFVLGSAAITALITAVVLRYLYAIDRWQEQVQASARAEADALQARIKPHFLFNSMNTIASLVRSQPQVAEKAVLDLSDLFRAALGAGEGDSTLAGEVELAERYLAIESLRLGERLQVAWDRREPLPWELPLPRLILQPMVENAVLHGISQLAAGGTVEITLAVDDGKLHVSVRNPAPPPREHDDKPPTGTHARHAQDNIGHRLAYAFGPEARMTADWNDGYYRAGFSVPLASPSARPGTD